MTNSKARLHRALSSLRHGYFNSRVGKANWGYTQGYNTAFPFDSAHAWCQNQRLHYHSLIGISEVKRVQHGYLEMRWGWWDALRSDPSHESWSVS